MSVRMPGCRDKLRKTRGATDAEGDEGRLPLGRIGEPLNLDLDAPSEVRIHRLINAVMHMIYIRGG